MKIQSLIKFIYFLDISKKIFIYQNCNYHLNFFNIASPIYVYSLTTVIPYSYKYFILLYASPLPPDTIAPAWPILFSAGAVYPHMKATTGF